MPFDGESLAVKVRVEDVLPSTGTVTGVGRLKLTPLGEAPLHAAVRLMMELDPLVDESRTVVDCDDDGDKGKAEPGGWLVAMLIVRTDTGAKTGGELAITEPEGVTISWSETECAMPPLVALTVKGYVPVATVPAT